MRELHARRKRHLWTKVFGIRRESGRRRVGCKSRGDQLRERRAERAGERLQHVDGEILPPVLHAREILISDPGSRGELFLGELLLLAKFADESSDGRLGVHFAYS